MGGDTGGWHWLRGSKGMDPAGKLNANPSLGGERVGGKGDDELVKRKGGGAPRLGKQDSIGIGQILRGPRRDFWHLRVNGRTYNTQMLPKPYEPE